MRVLCAIDQRGGPELIRRVAEVVGTENLELVLIHVIDTGPRQELGHLQGPVRRGPLGGPGRERALSMAEEAGGQATLDEALTAAQQIGAQAATRLERGKPEQVIVQVAAETGVGLIAIRASEGSAGHPRLGPASVGHIVRFVLDHAPCDVLLLREG